MFLYWAHYENNNVSVDDSYIEPFCEWYRSKSLIKDVTCFKNLEKPTCIVMILTNSPYCFEDSFVIESGLSDFNKTIISVMKTTFQNLKANTVCCKDYTRFSNEIYRKKKTFCWTDHYKSSILRIKVLKNLSKFASVHLMKWHRDKRNM